MTEQLLPASRLDKSSENRVEQLWVENRNRLLSKFRQWLKGDHAAAEDLLSEATMKLLLHGQYDELDSPVAWLTHVAWNLFLDGCRQRRRELGAVERLFMDAQHDGQQCHSVEEQLLIAECFEKVDDVVGALPHGQQRAFRLHILDGMDYRGVAETLDITDANARKRVQLARSLLRREVLA